MLRRARPCGVILFARNAVDPEPGAAPDGCRPHRSRRRGDPRPHRSGGRPGAAAAPPALACTARGVRLPPRLRRRSAEGRIGGAAGRAPHGRGPARARHQHQLRAAARRARAGQPTTSSAIEPTPPVRPMCPCWARRWRRVSWRAACCPSSSTCRDTAGQRATATTTLPVVSASRAELDATDFVPFRALADLPAAMTAHVVFTAYDAHAPASTSTRVTQDVDPRRHRFRRPADERRSRHEGAVGQRDRARRVPCSRPDRDLVLACSGDLAETESVAAVTPPLEGAALLRFERARAVFAQQPQPSTRREAEACIAEVCNWRPESV